MLKALLNELRRKRPEPPGDTAESLYKAAQADYAGGRTDAAWEACRRALALDGDYTACHYLMSQIALPGPWYVDVLGMIHRTLQPPTYLEIGVKAGRTLALAGAGTRVVGIDPVPQVPQPIPPNTTIHALTSDAYFETRDARADLGGAIALALIDGMHLFEFALRDFINVERACEPGSTIALHDTYPLDRRTAEREKCTAFSSGDVWRLVLVLKKYRPDLTVATVATMPTGLTIVLGLDPASRVLSENYDAIVREFLALDYSALEADKAAALNRFPNDDAAIEALITRSSPPRP